MTSLMLIGPSPACIVVIFVVPILRIPAPHFLRLTDLEVGPRRYGPPESDYRCRSDAAALQGSAPTRCRGAWTPQ